MSSKISVETKKPKFHKSLKLRIFPTENQKILINKTFGCCRQIYNNRLEEKQEFYINTILPVKNKITRQEKKELYKTFKPSTEKELALKFPYMKEVSSSALQQARMNCETAYKNFFQSLSGKRKERKVGFPNYKSKKDSRQSYREPQPKLEHFDFSHRTIKIPKLGKVYFKSHELPKWYNLVKDVCNLTIKKSSSGNYYCVVLFELKELFLQRAENRKNSIGLDFGPKNCYIDSDGKSGKDFGYVAQKQKAHKKLQKLQRKVNRQMLRPFVEKYGRYPNWKSSKDKINFKLLCKEQGFKNLAKTRTKLAKVSEKVANKRMEWIEKETLRLVRGYDKVVVEDLNLQGMSKFLTNAKNMTDTSWGTFVSKLQDKGKTFGCEVVKVDKYFPSSKLCHVCGWKYEKLQLSERSWICPECGTNHNRDHNAAINLKNYIPAEHGKSTAGEFDKNFETSERVASQLTSLVLGTDVEPANQKATTGRNPIGL